LDRFVLLNLLVLHTYSRLDIVHSRQVLLLQVVAYKFLLGNCSQLEIESYHNNYLRGKGDYPLTPNFLLQHQMVDLSLASGLALRELFLLRICIHFHM
jgi:hypothetical protein